MEIYETFIFNQFNFYFLYISKRNNRRDLILLTVTFIINKRDAIFKIFDFFMCLSININIF